jgi:hypothetical protein
VREREREKRERERKERERKEREEREEGEIEGKKERHVTVRERSIERGGESKKR